GALESQVVGYDNFALDGPSVSIIDADMLGYPVLAGNYSALVLGATLSTGEGIPATISQTALVPAGTKSVVVDMSWQLASPVVSLGGQTINMIPIKTFPTYTLYAGDISSFAGQTATLSFTEPPPPPGFLPNLLELDNIILTTASVPEPQP